MAQSEYDALRLNGQLCFPLYACSRELIRLYTPILREIDLTYTQYITMLVLWEHTEMTLKELGSHLYLDSGTLTPLLKKLEAKGLLSRTRSLRDERNLLISLTPNGVALREKALEIPYSLSKSIALSPEEYYTLNGLLQKLIDQCRNSENQE